MTMTPMIVLPVQFQSHQIFHVFVVAAAFIHYYGMAEIANKRLAFGHCFENAWPFTRATRVRDLLTPVAASLGDFSTSFFCLPVQMTELPLFPESWISRGIRRRPGKIRGERKESGRGESCFFQAVINVSFYLLSVTSTVRTCRSLFVSYISVLKLWLDSWIFCSVWELATLWWSDLNRTQFLLYDELVIFPR